MNKSYVLFSLFPILLLAAWQNRPAVQVQEDVKMSLALEAGPHAEIKAKVEEAEDDFFQISEHLKDGQKSNDSLNEEWTSWVGQSPAKSWQQLKFEKPYRLSMILSEVQSLADNPYRIMHIHSFGFNGEADVSNTFFTREIDGLDEKSLRSELVVSHKIEPQGDGYELSLAHRTAYQIGLKRQNFKRHYDLREPIVKYDFRDVDELDLDIVNKLITEGSGLTESGLYEREVDWRGKTYQVQMNLRQTKLGTTTIELQMRPVNSLTIQKFALIYEPAKKHLTKVVSK